MPIKPFENESKLLSEIAQGDHRAFCSLFDHYEQYVYGFGRKLTRSNDQAEEIVQDVFLKIWVGREKLVGIENFDAYLNRLVRNQSYSVLRQNLSHAKGIEKISSTQSEKDDSLESKIDYKETVKILNDAIVSLPEQQKRVYELCHQQGLKYEEAAEEMNISSATVHYHMKLALKAIREHFNKNAFAYPILITYLFK